MGSQLGRLPYFLGCWPCFKVFLSNSNFLFRCIKKATLGCFNNKRPYNFKGKHICSYLWSV